MKFHQILIYFILVNVLFWYFWGGIVIQLHSCTTQGRGCGAGVGRSSSV